MDEGALTLHPDATILYSNIRFSNMLNVPLDELMGSSFHHLIPLKCKKEFERLLKISKEKNIKRELEILNINGQTVPVMLSLARLKQEDSFVLNIIITDLTILKAKEKELKSKNAQLKAMNDELTSFAYTASHDLQEPLRTVTNYIGLFQKKYKETIDQKADEYLQVITGATSRMQTLISDLLEYSRIGRHETEMVEIDCNKLLQIVLADMSVTIKESNAVIAADKLPVITGYPTEIKSLFQNLISNAVKFRKKDVAPLINITAEDKGNEWLFAIKDNGIGIDKMYFDKIFIIFQRLHTRTEYSGTGIGLAHCKKIVELHKGKIWVESEPEKGSTFYFTIPKNLNEPTTT